MSEKIKLRPARPDDADVASVLLYSAYTHKQAISPVPETQENRFSGRLQHFFRQDGNRFSYQCTQIAEHGSDVVGLLLSFGGRDEERLNTAIGWSLQHEAEDDEWYVDAVAVFKPWGRQGIGTRLMQAAEQLARLHHYPKIALSVAQGNEEALSLYRRLQYVAVRQVLLYQNPYIHMEKVLAGS
jgi:ribosomal protein S18 acetylase RimI-like enzyme